jgi:hypothetical protein
MENQVLFLFELNENVMIKTEMKTNYYSIFLA